MASFSLSEAWNEGVAFVRNNLREVAIWAAIGVLVPIILQLVILGGAAEQQAMFEQMMAGGDPTAMAAALGGGVFLVSIVSQIISSASYFGAWRMGLSREPVAPPQAGVYALGAATTSLVLLFAIFIGLMILIGIPLGIFGALGGLGSGGNASVGGTMAAFGMALIALLLVIPLMLWLMARLSVMGPVMAAAGSVNPLYGITQSWRLTKPVQWPIFGYILLLVVAFIVIGMILALISGVGMIATGGMGAELGTGSLIFTAIISLIISIPYAIAAIGIPAGIYRALRPDPVSDIFS